MHTSKHLRFQINQLRQDKVIFAVESIAVFIFALFVSAFLPNLLLRYVYVEQNLTEIPPVLEYIPVIAFVVGVGYFLFAILGNLSRWNKIKQMEKELETMTDDDCNCGPHDHDHMHMNESVGLLAEKMKSTKTRKASRRN
jgi:hypothetical protein